MDKIKAWAFLAEKDKDKYFVTDEGATALIYLKKPKPRTNPFDYFNHGLKWKPTKIEIINK